MGNLISHDDLIFVAGHRGMAGSAICRSLVGAGYQNILTASRQELDLEDVVAVRDWFAKHKPNVVVSAAKVGEFRQIKFFLRSFRIKFKATLLKQLGALEFVDCSSLVVAVLSSSLNSLYVKSHCSVVL